MYISKVRISNYRCFSEKTIDFKPGLNVIIGENNAGKSTLLSALGLIFNRRIRPTFTIHDFHNRITRNNEPPSICVEVTLSSSGANDTVEEKALVSTWLTDLSADWKATISFAYFLPEEEHLDYKKELAKDESNEHYFANLEKFLDKYVARIYCGNFTDRIKAEIDNLDKFDMRYLEPIRDVESTMFSGSHPLLKRMLTRVIDSKKTAEEKQVLEKAFRTSTDAILADLKKRVDIDSLFGLIDNTGAGDGGKPDIEGKLKEADLISALKLMVDCGGNAIPATHNGLGYNNLIYMALLLKCMELEASTAAQGQNAKIFPIFAIEEPEAHLHPALQYKFIKHLSKDKSVKQSFITTHSTHVTSAVGLDSIVCLCIAQNSDVCVVYPGRTFPDTTEGINSKKYVERYLDATKSSMLFSKGVIFVEGIAEQLLVPVLSEYIEGCDLEKKHVAVIGVGGSTFKHFLPLFGAGARAGTAFLPRRVACILDGDPQRKNRTEEKARFKKCFLYEIDKAPELYDYQPKSVIVSNLETQAVNVNDIIIRHSDKTLEYDLAKANPGCELLLTDACTNKKDLKNVSKNMDPGNAVLSGIIKSDTLAVLSAMQADELRAKNVFATAYLLSVVNAKGEHAFELASKLRENYELKPEQKKDFKVPSYIEDSIKWVCRREQQVGAK